MDFNIAEYEAIVDTVSASILKPIFQKFLPVEFCLIFRKKIQSYAKGNKTFLHSQLHVSGRHFLHTLEPK